MKNNRHHTCTKSNFCFSDIRFQFLLFIFFLPLLWEGQEVKCQNLVPNPSFEDYTQCPNGQCQIDYATGWEIYSYSPDYFNSCASTFSVPNNPRGYQFAATGNAYAGIFIDYGSNGREYIGIAFSEPLTIGSKYNVKIKVAPSERAAHGFYCNNLGVLFSTISYAYPCNLLNIPNLLPQNFAHVYSSDIILDTLNWTTISGTFTADSAYQYIAIGNFFDNANTQFSAFDSTGYGAYYFIDDIEVYPDADTTSINQQQFENKISIYPNPSNQKIYFQNSSNNPFKTMLYNQYGILIKSQTIHKSENFISIDEIPNGIYFLKIHSNDFTITKKIIIQH